MSLPKADFLSWLKNLLEVVTFWIVLQLIDLQQVGVISQVSDHEIICVDSALEAVVLESKRRKVYLWHRADFELINNKAQDYCNYFTSHYTINTPIQDLWDSLKSFCMECVDLIPYKFHKTT